MKQKYQVFMDIIISYNKKIFLILILMFYLFYFVMVMQIKRTSIKPEFRSKNILTFGGDTMENKIHVITPFVDFSQPTYRRNLLYNKTRPPTDEEIRTRMDEVMKTLRSNLNHPKIASLHLLVELDLTIEYLKSLKFENKDKLVLHRIKESGPFTALSFIFKNFVDKYAIYVHEDNLFGESWNYFHLRHLRDRNWAYVLTRTLNPKCPSKYGTCILENIHYGSHDAFLFYVKPHYQYVNRDLLEGIGPSNFGYENVMAWYFKNKLNLTLKNPCLRLHLYHEHCVPIREKNRPVVNQNISVSVPILLDFGDMFM